MDELVKVALVGTAQAGARTLGDGSPVAPLVEGLPGELSDERRLLLRAGALAVYRQAGALAERGVEPHEVAPEETLRVCSAGAAALLRTLLQGIYVGLLREALQLMAAKGLRLPPELLALALAARDEDRRVALLPLLGERGRWLARLNSEWSWAHEALAPGGLPDDAETLWQEGTVAQRVELLRRRRASDPAEARAWLEEVWKQEKAETRAQMLATLWVGLGADDEAFIERALNDRAGDVREQAVALLGAFAGSAFNGRMLALADTMLVEREGMLDAEPPEVYDARWARDGISKKREGVRGSERAWWLRQVLAKVHPAHWEERFGRGPAELLEAVEKSDWVETLVEGWILAAYLFRAQEWGTPLWRWLEAAARQEQRRWLANSYKLNITSLFAVETLEAMAREAIERWEGGGVAGQTSWEALVYALPIPWSVGFSEFYLERLRACAQRATTLKLQQQQPWLNTLNVAAARLAPSSLRAALGPWELAPEPDRQVLAMSSMLTSFSEEVQFRIRLHEEIR